MKIYSKHLITLITVIFCYTGIAMGQDGATLFKQKCAACHKLGAKLVGPDLIGINERRSQEWLTSFIQSSTAMIEAGDPDAIAIFEEFFKMPMADQDLTDAEVGAVLQYIKDMGDQPESEPEATSSEGAPESAEYAEGDIEVGRDLFSGAKRFQNGGPSCLSCHNVSNDEIMGGGVLAKDLTNVYTRMGDAGIAGIVGAPPFPAMEVAYKDNVIDSDEIAKLTAFLKHADSVSEEQEEKDASAIYFLVGGILGLFILLVIFGIIWNKRLGNPVKHEIFKRQLKSK